MKSRLFATAAAVLTAMTTLVALLCLMGQGNPPAPHLALAAPMAAPTVTAVDPASAPNDLDTPIVITGTGFTAGMTVTLGSTRLPDAGWVSSTTLTATVPWGLNPGVYTLTVVNPDGQSGGLPNALTVTQGIGVWNAGSLYGGQVSQIVVNPITPTTLYAHPWQVGIFRSRDGGKTWSFNFSGWYASDLALDPISPNRLYIYSSGVGASLQRSDDEGDTWVRLTTSFPVTQTLGRDCEPSYRPYAHPTTSGTVYVAACGGSDEVPSGLIKSLDYGQTFTPAVNGLTDTQVTALAFHPTDPMTMYVGTANGNVFYSHNGGDTWHHASKPVGYVGTLAVNPFGAHEVWVSAYSQQGDPCAILKSANADLTDWTAIMPDPEQSQCATAIQFAPTTSGTIALVADALWKSIDGGDTWSNVWPTEIYGEIVNHAAFHPTDSNSLYAATMRTGVQKSVNGGITWAVANQGLAAAFPDQMTVVPDQPETVYAKFTSWNGIFKTKQGGQSWQFLPTPNGTPQSVLADPFQPARVYISTGRKQIYISDDGGQTWPAFGVITPPTQYAGCFIAPEVLRADPVHPGTLLCGVGYTCGGNWSSRPGNIFRSTDYGANWTLLNLGQEISRVRGLAYDPISPTIIYAATEGSGVFKSINDGDTWQPSSAGLGSSSLNSIAVEPAPPYRLFVSSGGGIYRSSDGGASWSPAQGFGGNPVRGGLLFAPGEPPLLYAATSAGLYRSSDGAQSWQPAAGVLGHSPVYALAVVTTTDDRVILYASTSGSVVEGSLAQVSALANANDALVNPGVYRYTTRLLNQRVYLPIIFKN